MDKNNSAMKTVIAAGAASAFCGITLRQLLKRTQEDV